MTFPYYQDKSDYQKSVEQEITAIDVRLSAVETVSEEALLDISYDRIYDRGTTWLSISTAGWTAISGVTLSADTNTVAEGGEISSLVVTNTVAGTQGSFDRTISLDLGESDILCLKVYIPEFNDLDSIKLFIGTNLSFTDYFLATITNGAYNYRTGWNTIKLRRSDFVTTSGSPSWDTTLRGMRIRITPEAAKIVSVNFGNIKINEKSLSKMVISFDDGNDSVFTLAYPAMESRNIKGTIYINSSTIGDAGKMTIDNLKTLYAAGWDVANHTSTHSHLTSGTLTAAKTDLINCRDYLLNLGFSRSANHIAYPYGEYNDDIIDIVKQIGGLTARDTNVNNAGTSTAMYENQPIIEPYGLITSLNLGFDETTATITTVINDCIEYGSLIQTYGHKILTAGSTATTEMDLDIFESFLDYVQSKNLETMTISEFYDSFNISKTFKPKKFPELTNSFEIFDDFVYQTLTEVNTPWILNKGSNGTAADAAIATDECGKVVLTTGSDSGTLSADGTSMSCYIPVQADSGMLSVETRLHINSAITGVSVMFGLTDVTTLEEPFTIAGTAITTVASDACCFVYDDGATTKEWFACSVDSNTVDTGNGTTSVAPAADTYQTLRIEVNVYGEIISFYIDNKLVKTLTNAGISENVNLYGIIIANSTAAASKTVDVDYIHISHTR